MNKSPRLFPNTVKGVLEALESSFGKGLYVNRVLENSLRVNKKWGSRDRSFVAEHTYEIVRWWNFLWAILDQEPNVNRNSLEQLFGVYWKWRGFDLPEWPGFDSIRAIDIDARSLEITALHERESYALWFSELAQEQLGDKWAQLAHDLNQHNSVNIRINTLKSNEKDVIQELADAGIVVYRHPAFPKAHFLDGRPKLKNNSSFLKGKFEIQDAGSQEISYFLNPTPGSVVIDACAGAGGKTLHLGALMENKGTLIAMEVEGRKLEELHRRTQRSGLTIMETRAWEEEGVLAELTGTADYLLLDAPCSGTGTIKREPDTKWKFEPVHLAQYQSLQFEILDKYPAMLKSGGTLVYATCSILPSENSDQIMLFLENHSEFSLIEERIIDPATNNDGFYMAKLLKA